MKAAVKLRKLISVLVTAAFFSVAALGIVNGSPTLDAFIRAGIASLVVTAFAIAFLRTVEDALARATDKKSDGFSIAARRKSNASADELGNG